MTDLALSFYLMNEKALYSNHVTGRNFRNIHEDVVLDFVTFYNNIVFLSHASFTECRGRAV